MPNIEEVQINEGDIPCWGKSDHTWGRWGQQIKISHMVCFQFTVETSFRSTVQWSRLNISKSFSMKDQGYIAFFIKGQLYRCVDTGWWNYDTTRKDLFRQFVRGANNFILNLFIGKSTFSWIHSGCRCSAALNVFSESELALFATPHPQSYPVLISSASLIAALARR